MFSRLSRSTCPTAIATLLVLILGALPLDAQLGSRPGPQKPTARPTRLGPEAAIEIDGFLNEEAWSTAETITHFTQVVPVEGAPPGKDTTIRLMYDKDYLYLGFECEEDPHQVFAKQMRRDDNVRFDDVVEWWIDTFDDQRFGFWFQITPGGSLGDALLSDNGTNFNKDWDGIWYGQSRVGAPGWVAEIAIPFKTLSFDPDGTAWGFNLRRRRKIIDEEMRWASPSLAYRFFTLSEGGRLVGMEGMQQGVGLDLIPYVKVSGLNNRTGTQPGKHLLGTAGIDASYRITPSMNLRMTVNTDFAETEVDDRQVNLDRFPLFFPEKRDFFLADAGVFAFGSPDRRSQLVPFFSRRIGRDDNGQEAPILLGTKLTGRAGDWNIGALATVLDAQEDQSEKGLGVVRISRNLGGENSVGGIATFGRPNDPGSSSTLGVDFRLGSTRLFGDARGGSVWGYLLNSSTEGVGGDGNAYGLQGRFRSAEVESNISYHVVEPGFGPELGFVRRGDSRQFRVDSQYTWRNPDDTEWLRRVNWRIAGNWITDHDGETQSWSVPFRWFQLVNRYEDRFELETHRIHESVGTAFDLSSGITIPQGDYTGWRHFLEVRSSNRRVVSGEIEASYGDFFDGRIFTWSAGPRFVPNKHLFLSLDFQEFHVDLSGGDNVTRVIQLGADWSFTPEVSWRNLVQFDNESDNIGVQSRMRWILEPGRDLFVVGQYGWQRDPVSDSFTPTDQELIFKLNYTVRF